MRLRPIWATKSLGRDLAIRVLRSSVLSALVYGLHTLYYSQGLEQMLTALQSKAARRALGIRSTYASTRIGEEPFTNTQVAEDAGMVPLSAEVSKKRHQLLCHILRRGGGNPARAATYDRFAQPKTLPGGQQMGRH